MSRLCCSSQFDKNLDRWHLVGSDSADGQPFIKAVKPGSQAAELPQLKINNSKSINSKAVKSFAEHAALQAGRPVTLVFRDAPEEQNGRPLSRTSQDFYRLLPLQCASDVVEAFDAGGFLPSTWLPELEDMQARGELGAF